MTKPIQSITDLSPDVRNANKGTKRGRQMVIDSLREVGAGRSIVVDREGRVIAGNKTLEGALAAGLEVEVVESDGKKLVVVRRNDLDLADDEGTARRLAYLDNRAGETGLAWDAEQILADLSIGLSFEGIFEEVELDALLAGLLPPDPNDKTAAAKATLAERFIIPPFSVLDARQGYWQTRKAAWIALGIESELGRGSNLILSGVEATEPGLNYYRKRNKMALETSPMIEREKPGADQAAKRSRKRAKADA